MLDSPDIAGLRYRLLDPETDFPRMSQLYNLVAPVNNPEFLPRSPESLAQDLASQTANYRRNQLIVEVAGTMIGWGACDLFHQRKDLDVGFHEFFLLPEWRHRGIEEAALRYLEQRVSELFCASPAVAAIFKIAVNEADVYQRALLQSAGYTQLAAHAIMVRPALEPIPAYTLPDGIEIRPVADKDVRAIYEAHCEAFKEHIHGLDPSDEGFAEWINDESLSDHSLWVVAWIAKRTRLPADSELHSGRRKCFYTTVNAATSSIISVLRPIAAVDWRGR
jgi:GNAT superfamily N-acetyltransferase